MAARFGVLARVPVWRRVAAERDSASLARAEVNPQRVGFYTLFAFMLFRMFDGIDGVDMRTGLCAHTLVLSFQIDAVPFSRACTGIISCRQERFQVRFR